MCGRFNLRANPALLAEIFQLARVPDLSPRYNIAPTQPVAVVRQADVGRELSLLRWGLVPSWAKDVKIGNSLINARAESVATKPAFRSAFKRRRCLIPATGFYEWQKTGGKTKQPFHIELTSSEPFVFAGLWESWAGNGAEPLESCTIITGEPNELVREIHDRMPVILQEEDYDRWLDPRASIDALEALLVPYSAEQMRATAISPRINSPRNDGPDCIKSLTE